MSAKEDISHPGIIDKTTNDSVFVKILSMSACSSCHAKSMCSIAEMEEKFIEVKKDSRKKYEVGEEVTVTMKRSLGPKAVFLGYILPFLLLFGVLLAVILLSGDEGLAGLLAIAVLIPYYWLLYIFRNKLSRTFSFMIE